MAIMDFNPNLDWSVPDMSDTTETGYSGPDYMADPLSYLGGSITDYASQNGYTNQGNSNAFRGNSTDYNQKFTDWFNDQGLSLKTSFGPGYGAYAAFDRAGNPTGKMNIGSLDDPVFSAIGAMLAAASGNVMGAGAGLGAMGTGAFSGGLGGLAGSGGDPMAGLKGAITGGLGGAASSAFNPAASMGVENSYLQKAINGGLKGTLVSALKGGDPLQGAIGGAFSPMVNYGASQMGFMPPGAPPEFDGGLLDGAPDIGTGSYIDAAGENSATLGGESPMSYAGQAIGDAQLGRSQQQGGAVSKVMSVLGLEGGPINGFNGKPMDMGNLASGLAGLWSAYDQRRKASEMMKAMSGNFGQGGAYAKAMRQQLDRRDAAGGRRSQYGPREVELQAKLAEMNSRQLPGLMSMYQAKSKGDNAMLNNLLQLGKTSGLYDLFKGD